MLDRTRRRDEAADEPALLTDAEDVERLIGSGYAVAWGTHSRFLQLVPLMMEHMVRFPEAAPVLWPLLQRMHHSHLGVLHPMDVIRMIPHVRRGSRTVSSPTERERETVRHPTRFGTFPHSTLHVGWNSGSPTVGTRT